LLKKFCQCVGLASLILVMNYGDLLGGGYDVRMHVPYALGGVVLAQALDILLLGTGIFVVVAVFSRGRGRRWVRLGLALVAPPIVLVRVQAMLPFPVARGWLLLAAVVWVGLVVGLLLRFKGSYRVLLRVGDGVGVFLAAFAACSLVQLAYVARWKPGPHEQIAAWSVGAQPERVHPKLVWIVFDELSYDQLFEHRAAGLELPHFDALSAESTVFRDVQPIGAKTVKVLPSLLSGEVIGDYHFSFANRLSVRAAGQREFRPLTGANTLFADAQRAGWRTGAVGWYNPYCTVFAGTIDDCYWMDLDKLDGPMEQTASLAQNVVTPLRQVGLELVAPARAAREMCDMDVRQRYTTHIDLEHHALTMLNDDQADFVFLHLPVPHSPSVWRRAQGAYTQSCGGSYLDGLALADRELGLMMASLRSSPRWKDTTVIVEGDHSWRSYLWKSEPAWTEEDRAASERGFDPRPAVMVHLAGQDVAQVDTGAWSLLKVHGLVETVLRGEAVAPRDRSPRGPQ
jgi:hypothetical protein